MGKLYSSLYDHFKDKAKRCDELKGHAADHERGHSGINAATKKHHKQNKSTKESEDSKTSKGSKALNTEDIDKVLDSKQSNHVKGKNSYHDHYKDKAKKCDELNGQADDQKPGHSGINI